MNYQTGALLLLMAARIVRRCADAVGHTLEEEADELTRNGWPTADRLKGEGETDG